MTDDINLSDHDLDIESLERVIRHSSNPYARACAWTLLDLVCDDPELADLQDELQELRDGGVNA